MVKGFTFTVFVVNETTRALPLDFYLDLSGPRPRLVFRPGTRNLPPFHCWHILVPVTPELLVDATAVAPLKVWDGVPVVVLGMDEDERPVLHYISRGQGVCFVEGDEDATDGVVRLTFPEIAYEVAWLRRAA